MLCKFEGRVSSIFNILLRIVVIDVDVINAVVVVVDVVDVVVFVVVEFVVDVVNVVLVILFVSPDPITFSCGQ